MSSRYRSSSFDPDQDNLLKVARAVQILDTVDSLDRRDQQMEMQNKQLLLEAERNELGKVEAQRLQDLDRLKIWEKGRAETAASYAAAEVSKIDLDTPEGEKALDNWLSYTKANGVSGDDIQIIFGGKMRERDVKAEYHARQQAEALGADGLELYNAFRSSTGPDGNAMGPKKASNLAIESKRAQATLAYWQEKADKAGVPFVLTSEDWGKIKQRIGADPTASAPTGITPAGPNSLNNSPTVNYTTFDPRPVYYNIDGINEAVEKHLKPKLDALSLRDDQKAARDAREQEATIGLKTSQGKEAEANATKATFEANVYKNLPSGTAAPSRTPSPVGNLFPSY